MRKWFYCLFFPLMLFTQETPSPEQVQLQLQQAEADFQKAQTMFSPWYTGPLITPGVAMMPPAHANVQPYLFLMDNYAAFNEDRKSVDLPSSLFQMKSSTSLQTGITDNMDINFVFTGQGNWQHHHCGGGFSDLQVVAGFLIYTQSIYVPAAKLTITQTFPTGKYKRLDSFLVDSTGAGAYSTQFGLGFSKIIFWWTPHPLHLRCFFGYSLSTVVNVSGFNSYGGGYGCRGRVRPGNVFTFDFGAELSLTQRWVAALDVVYSATDATKFHGNPGVLKNGTPSVVGTGYADNLSLAPALEYNFNPNMGLIAGAWFSVYGRNSLNFAGGIISFTYSFP